MDLIEVAKQLGPFAGLLVFFVWRDAKREERLGARLDAMQERYAAAMEGTVKNCAESQNKMSEAVNSLVQTLPPAMTRLADALHDKPCLLTIRDKESV
jgi:hypothetical protein